MTFLHQKHPEAFYFPKIVKSKNLDKNTMQDKRGSEPMLVCCVVFFSVDTSIMLWHNRRDEGWQ